MNQRKSLFTTVLWLMFCLLPLGGVSAKAQQTTQRTITGVVKDANGQPIPGATLYAKETSRGVASGADGSFTIKIKPTEKVLRATFVGMEPREVPLLADEDYYVIVLYEQAQGLDELVVTGYQTISKERTTGSYVIIDQKEVNKKLNPSLFGRLEGSVAGVMGRSSDLQIRGVATLMGDSSPLIVVDDMPFEGSISSINPATIEKITVLKDAAAASIYGARAANGVIVINTLRGDNTNTFKVSYDGSVLITPRPSYHSLNRMSSADVVDMSRAILEERYPDLKWSAIGQQDFIYPYFMEVYAKHNEGLIEDATYEAMLQEMRTTDNSELIRERLLRVGILHTHNLTLVQNGKKSRYIATINYSGNRPTSILTENRRVGVSLRNLTDFTKRLSGDVTMAANFDHASAKNGSPNALSLINSIPSFLPIIDENGVPLNILHERSEASINRLLEKGLEDEHYNPLRDMNTEWTKRKSHYMRLNARLSYKILPELSVVGSFQIETNSGYDKRFFDKTSYTVRVMRNDATIKENGAYVSLIPEGGQLSEHRSESRDYTFRLQANYDKQLGSAHRLTALAGTEVRRLHTTSTSSYLMGYDDVSLGSIPYDAARLSNLQGTQSMSGNFSFDSSGHNRVRDYDNRFLSIYANFVYDYLQKYNITGSIRIDQSNLFGVDPKVQYRPLWSLGTSWAVHKEEAVKAANWLDRLTVRLTYGIGGNIPKAGGPYLVVKTGIYNKPAQVTSSEIVSPPNRSLTWERTATLNLGFDFALWKNRLYGTVDVYDRATTNLLGHRLVDPSIGWNSLLMNYGSMNNRGVELTLNSVNIATPSFRWSTRFVFGYNRNKILEIDEREKSIQTYLARGVETSGKPANSLYALEWAGLYATSEDGTRVELGQPHVYTTDENGKKVPTLSTLKMEDLVHQGTMTPIWNGGFTNTFEYKGLSLTLSFVYYGGHKMRDVVAPYITQTGFVTTSGYLSAGLKNAWRKEGDELLPTTTPVLSKAFHIPEEESASWYGADVHVIRADHLRLRDLVLAYSLPAQLLNPLHISNLTLSFQVNNLFYIAKNNRGIDPEVGRGGVKEPVTCSCGLSVTF